MALAYDTDHGRMCPRCRKPAARCRCAERVAPPSGDGIARVRREVRNGKPVTVVTGLSMPLDQVREAARELKRRCGSGGTVKEGAIELQGDWREQVIAWLEQRGIPSRLAGG